MNKPVASSNTPRQSIGAVLDAPLRDRLRRLVEHIPEPRLCGLLGFSPPTLTRACAGFPVQYGTIALCEQRIPQIEQQFSIGQ